MNKFTEKSLDELLSYFGEDFYKRIDSKEDFIDYLQAISHRVLETEGVKSMPQYTFGRELDKASYLGQYGYGKISLNNKLIDGFDEFKKKDNLTYIFEMINAIIHESRHFLQDKGENIHPIIKNYYNLFAVLPQEDSNVSYSTSAIEIDARYYAYQIVKEHDNFKGYINSSYRNNEFNSSISPSSHYADIINILNGDFSVLQKISAQNFEKTYMPFLESLKVDLGRMRAFLATRNKRNDYLVKQALNTYPNVKSRYKYFSDTIQLRSRNSFRLQEYLADMAYNSFNKSIDSETKEALWHSLGRRAYICHESNNLYKKIAPEFAQNKYCEISSTTQRQEKEGKEFDDIVNINNDDIEKD